MLSFSWRAGRKWKSMSWPTKRALLLFTLCCRVKTVWHHQQYSPHSCQILWHLSVKILLSVIFIFGTTKRTGVCWSLSFSSILLARKPKHIFSSSTMPPATMEKIKRKFVFPFSLSWVENSNEKNARKMLAELSFSVL